MPTTHKPVRFREYYLPDGTIIFEGENRDSGYKRRLAGPTRDARRLLRLDFPNARFFARKIMVRAS